MGFGRSNLLLDDLHAALGAAVLGGAPLSEDLGYGPCRCLEPSDVAATAAALGSTDPEALAKRYDAARMNQTKVYPGGFEEDGSHWLIEAWKQVAAYYSEAAGVGHAVLLVIQ